MTNPYLFDSSDDYYDSLLTPQQRKINGILEDDPVEYLDRFMTEEDWNKVFQEHFESIIEHLEQERVIEELVKECVYSEFDHC